MLYLPHAKQRRHAVNLLPRSRASSGSWAWSWRSGWMKSRAVFPATARPRSPYSIFGIITPPTWLITVPISGTGTVGRRQSSKASRRAQDDTHAVGPASRTEPSVSCHEPPATKHPDLSPPESEVQIEEEYVGLITVGPCRSSKMGGRDFFGTHSQNSRGASRDYLGSTRECCEEEPENVPGQNVFVDLPRFRRSLASQRGTPLSHPVHGHGRGCPRRSVERQPGATAEVTVPHVHDVQVHRKGPKLQPGVPMWRPQPDWTHAEPAVVIAFIREYHPPASAKKLLPMPKKDEKVAVGDGVGQLQPAGKAATHQIANGLCRGGEYPVWRVWILREQQNVFQWGGWADLFKRIVSLKDRSQLAKLAAESITYTFSQLQSRQRRIPMPDGRSRARRRRGLIHDMLRSCIDCSLRWLQTGCLRLSEALPGRSLRQLVSRSVKEACCTSPLNFPGDERGRLREILANIVNGISPTLNSGSAHFG